MLRIPVVLILGLLISATVAGRAEDWPQFRGPGGQGQAVGAGWPLRWSEQEGIGWKVPIPGRGWSSPVVAGQQIWLTTALETAATVLASPVATGGRIYFFGEAGTTTVVRPGKQFEQLAENHLDGRVLASPALVDQAIILRTATTVINSASTGCGRSRRCLRRARACR